MSRIKQILVGAGRIFDFSGSYRAEAISIVRERRRDILTRTTLAALYGDWGKIGADILKAMGRD